MIFIIKNTYKNDKNFYDLDKCQSFLLIDNEKSQLNNKNPKSKTSKNPRSKYLKNK